MKGGITMNKYALIAINSADYIDGGLIAKAAWEKASCEIFSKGSSSQVKGCPKNAFLGLFSEDPKFINNKNATYACDARSILRENPYHQYSKIELWKLVAGENKTHNSQIDVVMELWNAKKIK